MNKTRRRKKQDLLAQLAKLTGISVATIRRELKDILDRKNINIHDITLEQLRTVTASYLRQIMCSVLSRSRTKDHAH